MISAATVYDTCLALIKKDSRGRAFSLDEYNSVSALVNMELYNSFLAKYENGMSTTDALLHLKIRNTTLTLTAGQAWLPAKADRLAGNPWMAHPWGVITATAEVEVMGYPDTKVKITSADHGLKDGAVITATGLSAHTITDEAIHYIDKNNFWVDVDYVSADTLTSAAWTLDGASYKEIDMLTEAELAARWANSLVKPSIQNPAAVLDMGNPEIWIDSDTILDYLPSGHSFGIVGTNVGISVRDTPLNDAPAGMLPLSLKTGDLVTIYGGTDGSGTSRTGYNGTWRVVAVPRTGPSAYNEVYYFPDLTSPTAADPTFAFVISYNRKRINVFPTNIPTVYINYIERPDTPFLDYYVDANYVINYLAYGEQDATIAAGEEYRDGTAGATTVDSITQDWEWDADLLPEIVYRILLKAGINLENMNVTQIAAQLQAKEESQV